MTYSCCTKCKVGTYLGALFYNNDNNTHLLRVHTFLNNNNTTNNVDDKIKHSNTVKFGKANKIKPKSSQSKAKKEQKEE